MAELKKIFCATCKKPFFRSTGRYNESLKLSWKTFCSKKCQSEHKKKRKILTCENCGKSFERVLNDISNHNYCSQSCAATINNKNHPKKRSEFKKCLTCGRLFPKSLNQKFCSLGCRRLGNVGRRGKIGYYTPENIIKIINDFFENFKRVPTQREMGSLKGAGIRFFGSWNKTILSSGLQPNRSHNQRMYKRMTAKSIDGHPCDSVSELLIDNWLFENRIAHQRNTPYPNTHHRADWSVVLKNKMIFIEYFGLASDSPKYDRSVQRKKELCQKHNIKLIEIYPQDLYPKIDLEEKLKIFSA
ncbi:MAG: hypothetical protein PHW72_00595 [Candidatus Pacebacteria bacterium]|nr:hypothetical protein [Candidatus Paceibacterota bacterium]